MSLKIARMGLSTSRQMQDATESKASTRLDQEVLEEILLNLPAEHVVLNCRLVCREWKDLVDSTAHWRQRCRREGLELRDASRQPDDWRMFYFLSKKRRNLLKNPRADDELRGWTLLENNGDGWKIEENFAQLPNDTNDKCFATSFGICLKEQLINLKRQGYNNAFMDNLQPDIKISDWYAPRWDCGSRYQIRVDLLDHKKKPISTFEPEPVLFEQWNDQQWSNMTHVFRDYGSGVRFIRFTHGGQDTQFWKGWYGIRVINSSVEICPAVER